MYVYTQQLRLENTVLGRVNIYEIKPIDQKSAKSHRVTFYVVKEMFFCYVIFLLVLYCKAETPFIGWRFFFF